MALCQDCVTLTDQDMLQRRVQSKGIPEDEDQHWNQTYNATHKDHLLIRVGEKGKRG